MTPKDGPRDWDKELAEVDKLIAGLEGKPQPPGTPARKGPGAAQELSERRGSQTRRDLFAVWLWFLLAVALGTALVWFWPYSRSCGAPLYGYLGAVVVFAVAGLCTGIWTWRMRMAWMHWVAMGLLFMAVFLGAREVLPRVGYAKRVADWECPTPPRPAAPVAPVGTLQIDSAPASAVPPAAPTVTRPPSAAPVPAPAPATAPGQGKAQKP